MGATHADILSMRLGDFKDVPPTPVGTYAARITSIPKIDKMGKKQNLGCEFSFKLTAPQADVDSEELAASGGLPEDPMTYTFWITPKAAIILQRFLIDVLGLTAGQSIPDACAQTPGLECLVVVEHGTSQKTGRKFAQIASFAKVD